LRDIFTYIQSKGEEKFKLRFYDKYFVRRLLIAQVSVNDTEDREYLVKLYRELGYLDADLKSLKSRFWWTRLAAAVRLEALEADFLSERFTRLIEDPNDFVAIVAMRAISVLGDPGRIDPILDALSRRAPSRRDLFVEMFTNLAGHRSLEVLDYLRQTFDPYVASICVEVLGQLKLEESYDQVLRLLKSSDDGVVESCTKALGILEREEAMEHLRPLLKHENERIRSASLRSLKQLKDPRLQWALKDLKSDPSRMVQRALFEVAV